MGNAKRIIDGLHEAIAHARGEVAPVRERIVRVPDNIDVYAIRSKLGLSQREFAFRFNFNLATLQQWEQKRRFPEGPARTLLTLIDRAPEQIQKLLIRA